MIHHRHMLSIREYHNILRICSTRRQTELRCQHTSLLIDLKHRRRIDTRCRTEQMLSVRCQRDRLRSIMTRIHLAQDRTHTLDTFKVNILIITGIAVYINLSGQLTDHIRKFTRLVKHKLSRSRLQITAQDIHQKQLVL